MQSEPWRTRLFWLVLGIALTAIVGVFGEPILNDIRGSGPVGHDKRQVRTEAAETARYIAAEKSFENSEGKAWLVVLRHSDALDVAHAPVADEIRIYQERPSGLELAFHLQPPQLPGGKTEPSELVFQLRAVRDLTGDDEPEVVGAYYTIAMGPFNPRPIVIYRDDADHPYRAVALGDKPPRGPKNPGLWGRIMRENYYLPPANIADIASGTFQPAGGTEEYAVVGRDPAVFLGTYIARSGSHAEIPLLQVQAAYLDPRFRRLMPVACRALPEPHLTPTGAGVSYPREIREHWVDQQAMAPRRICPATLGASKSDDLTLPVLLDSLSFWD